MVKDNTILNGMREICQVVGRSESTVLALKRRYPHSMPIRKIENTGAWTSEREALVSWWRAYVADEVNALELEAAAKAKAKAEKKSKAGKENNKTSEETRPEPALNEH